MTVILPPQDVNNILKLLADPEAVRTNISELQSMAEQAQRDQSRVYTETAKLNSLKQELLAKEDSITATNASQDSRAAELTSYASLLAEREIKVSEREQACLSSEEDAATQKATNDLQSTELDKRQSLMDAQALELQGLQAKLEQLQKANEEWRASISSTLSQKP
jgi:capsule polysaccharide export protein KpsE/RkpR